MLSAKKFQRNDLSDRETVLIQLEIQRCSVLC
jgi:hypothetical protein